MSLPLEETPNTLIDSEKLIEESLERQAKKKEVFINFHEEDILDKLINIKKRKIITLVEGTSIVNEASNKVTDIDQIFINNQNHTVGHTIKTAAIKKWATYYNGNDAAKTIVTLGLNSILDLSYAYPDGQASLFSREEWLHLKLRNKTISLGSRELEVSNKTEDILYQAEKICSRDPEKAAKIINKHLHRSCDLTTEEEFILFTYAHVIEFINYNQYMFDTNISKNEQDYLLKLWGPIMERLVRKTSFRLKWGESSCSLIDSSLRADLRVIHDVYKRSSNNEHDLMNCEASRGSPSSAKYNFDHCKCLIESKGIIDSNNGKINEIFTMQFCGLELFLFSLEHKVDCLYIADRVGYVYIPPATTSLSFVKRICNILLFSKDQWTQTQQSINLNVKDYKSAYSPAVAEEEAENNKKISPSWYPPRPNQVNTIIPDIPSNIM